MVGGADYEDIDQAIRAAQRLIEVSGAEARGVAEEFLAKARAARNDELVSAWELILKAVMAITAGPPPGETVH